MKFLKAFLFTAAVLVSSYASTATFSANIENASFVQTLTADGFDATNVIQVDYHNCDYLGTAGTAMACANAAAARRYPRFNTYGYQCYGCF